MKIKIEKSLRKTTEEEKQALNYLNALRDSGIVNMFGAREYVQDSQDVDKKEAMRLLKLWMSNFNEEGNYETVKTN